MSPISLEVAAGLLRESVDDPVCTISFCRDETDSFVYEVEGVSEQASSAGVTKAACAVLLPAGSSWRVAKGWRSFSGIPLAIHGTRYVSLGVCGIIDHPTRGASPEYYAFLLRDGPACASTLRKLASQLSQGVTAQTLNHPRGVLSTSSASPESHGETEAQILATVAQEYATEHLILFRTLILAESELGQIPPPKRTTDGVFGDSYLVATVPSIARHFSPLNRAKLTGLKHLW